MLEDKNIHDIFEHANLDNEDWLQPSDKVLEEIEAAIYPRKRFRWFAFLLLLILVLSGCFVYFYSSNLTPHATSIHQTSPNNTNEPQTPIIPNQLKATASKENIQLTNNIQKNIEATSKKKNISSDKQNSISLDNEKEHRNIAQANKETVKKKTDKDVLIVERTANTILKNKSIPIIKKNVPLQVKNLNIRNVHLPKRSKRISNIPIICSNLTLKEPLINRIKNTIFKNDNVKENKTQAVKHLALREPSLFKDTQPELLRSINSNILPKKSKNWQYEFFTGFSSWNLNLNQDFAKVLKPADFTHNMGKGFFVSASAQKNLNPTVSIKANIQYEQVVFQSSHHTNKWYHPDNEIDQTNTFDVSIATPLGFTNADLTVRRANLDLDQATKLNIDLQNSHQVFTIDAGIQLSAQFIDFVKLSAETVFLLGIHQVLFVDNRLRSFGIINHHEFEPLNNTKPSQQAKLNKTRPYAGMGLQLNYLIKSNQALQLQYLFKQDALSLYKENNYKSFLNRQQIGLGYSIQF